MRFPSLPWRPRKMVIHTLQLEKTIEARIRRILAEGKVESKEDEILMTTTYRLARFLGSRSDQVSEEDVRCLKQLQREVAFFLTYLFEVILRLKGEEKTDTLEKLQKLYEAHSRCSKPVRDTHPEHRIVEEDCLA